MKKLSLVLVLLSIIFLASAQKVVTNSTEVRAANTQLTFNGNQLYYALPKNIVRVEFTIQQTQLFEGPYARYASKYLNINDGVIGSNKTNYEISNIKMDRFSVIDSSKFFAISNVNAFNIPEIKLNSDGVIISYNSNSNNEGYKVEACPTALLSAGLADYMFDDLGVRSFMTEKSETLYRTVKTDTSETQVPYTHKKSASTSEEMNAEEAAAFIRKLRKRRLKLLTGVFEETNAVGGQAMKIMIAELEKLEQQYLNLFTGVELVTKQKYYFDFEAEEGVTQEQVVLGWFSPKNGLSSNKNDAQKSDFKSILLKSIMLSGIPPPKIDRIDNTLKTPAAIKYGLYYRIPGRVNLTIQCNNNILIRQQMQIAQKGEVVPLPKEYLIDRKFAIDFYSQTGGIKSITLNKD